MVAAHCGTGWRRDRPDFLPRFIELARRRENLWGDTAVLGSPTRVRDVARLLAAEGIGPRLLHGSDFPFPSMPLAFARSIGLLRALRLQADRNVLRRDLRLKEALGFAGSAGRSRDLLAGRERPARS